MSEAGSVTLESLGSSLRDVQSELREMRRERRSDMELVTGLVRRVGRVDTRVGQVDGHLGDLRADLELMIRAELMGRLGQFETSIDHRLDRHGERLSDLERQSPGV